MKVVAFLFPFIAGAALVFYKYIMFALMLGVMQYQIANWDEGKHETEKTVSYAVPETDSELTLYAKRSNPIQPEFDRRVEVRTSGQLSQKVDITGDTSGANIVDLYVKREGFNLRLYLTSPRFFESEKRFNPGSVGTYPDLDTLSTGQQEHPMNQQKFWVLFDEKVPLANESTTRFGGLTHLGHFDTRYMKWVPASLSADSET